MTRIRTATLIAGAAILAAVTAALTTCAPPYLEALDRSAAAVKKMTLVGTVGPVGVENDATNVRFYPSRPTAPSLSGSMVQSGFLVFDAGSDEQISFVSGTNNGPGNGQSLAGAAAAAPFPFYQYFVSAAASGQAGVFVANIAASTYQYFMANLSGGSLTTPISPGVSGLNAASIVGLSEQAGSSVVGDTLVFLKSTPLSMANTALSGDTDQLGIGASAPVTGPLAIPTPAMLYENLTTGVTIASYYAGGQWVCQQWTGAVAVTPYIMTGVTHRIDAMLTTNDLLSTEGGTLRVYDSNGTGTQVASLSIGNLQYCYEMYVGSTPYVFFALPMEVSHGNWVISVYAVATSSVRNLGG